jgi:hypothetical protein
MQMGTSSMNAIAPQNIDDHVFLVGRPPIAEYVGFIATFAVDGAKIPQGVLAGEWRAANDHVRQLEVKEAGLADNPPIDRTPKSQDALVKAVTDDPIFKRSFQLVPADIGVVELDRLIVFQKYINLSYVRALQGKLGKKPTDDDVFRFCMPVDHPAPPVRLMQVAPNSYTFISSSNDFRFVEARLFGSEDLTHYVPQGPVTSVLGLVIGYGANFLNVVSVENRLILLNGSHRAYALRELGIKRIPCIIQRITRREELEAVIQGEVSQKPDLFLKAPRPPMLKDYFDPALTKQVPVVRKNRLVKVSFGVEQFDIPST